MKRNYFAIAGLAACCLWSCSKPEEKKSDPLHPQAAAYLEAYNREYKRLSTEANEAAWLLNTKIEEGDTVTQKLFEAAAQKLTDFTGSLANIDTAKKYLAIADQLSPIQKKGNGVRAFPGGRRAGYRG